MKHVVIDASVVVRFLIKEDDTVARIFSEILRQTKKKKYALFSSPLLALEVGNGLRFSINDARLIEEGMRLFFRLPIGIIALSDVQVQKAVSLSYVCRTTVYDASYHVLAIARNATYLTADREYYTKAKHIGRIELV